MPSLRTQRGQATVETVALLPLVALVGLLLAQAAVAAQAFWLAGSAARAAARAQAVGADPRAAARVTLPGHLERGLRVGADEDAVRVRVRIPVLLTGSRLAQATAQAHLQPQGG